MTEHMRCNVANWKRTDIDLTWTWTWTWITTPARPCEWPISWISLALGAGRQCNVLLVVSDIFPMLRQANSYRILLMQNRLENYFMLQHPRWCAWTYCIVFLLIEVRLFILYSNLYLWEETICDTTLGVAAPIIRSAAANSYMYNVYHIYINSYKYIALIHILYIYVITYRATFNNKLTTPSWVWVEVTIAKSVFWSLALLQPITGNIINMVAVMDVQWIYMIARRK